MCLIPASARQASDAEIVKAVAYVLIDAPATIGGFNLEGCATRLARALVSVTRNRTRSNQ